MLQKWCPEKHKESCKCSCSLKSVHPCLVRTSQENRSLCQSASDEAAGEGGEWGVRWLEGRRQGLGERHGWGGHWLGSERRGGFISRHLRSSFLLKLCEAFGAQADGLWGKTMYPKEGREHFCGNM